MGFIVNRWGLFHNPALDSSIVVLFPVVEDESVESDDLSHLLTSTSFIHLSVIHLFIRFYQCVLGEMSFSNIEMSAGFSGLIHDL